MFKGVRELAMQRGDELEVGALGSVLVKIVDLGAPNLDLSEFVGELLEPRSALGRGHRPGFESSEVSVDGAQVEDGYRVEVSSF